MSAGYWLRGPCAGAFCVPANHASSNDRAVNSLRDCIRSNMGYNKYADARDTAHNKCSKELEAWLRWCSNGSVDAGPRFQCEQKLTDITNPIDRDWRVSHPDPVPQKDPKVESALQDLRGARPLPGLPSLKKPVLVMKDSVVCTSPGALVNPNRDLALLTGACSLISTDIPMGLYTPDGCRFPD
jgi:hypothetical protein